MLTKKMCGCCQQTKLRACIKVFNSYLCSECFFEAYSQAHSIGLVDMGERLEEYHNMVSPLKTEGLLSNNGGS